MPFFSCVINDELSAPLRLDRYVSENLRLLSRSQIKVKLLKAKLNGKEVKLSRGVKHGDHIELLWEDAHPSDIIPQDIPLEVVFENSRCIVINKAQGMVVHPGAGNRQGTLVNALLFHKEQRTKNREQRTENKEQLTEIDVQTALDEKLFTESGSSRPGIVHRLDKDTSGLIIAAWDDEALAFLADQFKNRKVKKDYIAIVRGVPKENKNRIETYIKRDPKNRKRFAVSADGRHAVTLYKVIKQWKNYSLIMLRPKTGRTHQLRVHLRHIGCPILGDPIYGSVDRIFPDASLMLHSKRLAVILPGEINERNFSSVIPERFIEITAKLNKMGKADG